jgi:hypothetical protein
MDEQEQEEHIEGPAPGELDPKMIEALMAQFKKLTPEQKVQLLHQAAVDDMYQRIIMGQASHQDISNALRAYKDAQITLAPPEPPEGPTSLPIGKTPLPSLEVLEDYTEVEDEAWSEDV